MPLGNSTIIMGFVLLGISSNLKSQVIMFNFFMIGYMLILIGNILFITLIRTDPNLHTPMYFFLANLAFLDICYSTSVVPRALKDLLSAKKIISYGECATQMYLALSFGITECILLTIISFDRFIAICYPLHYTIIMSRVVCIRIAVGTWLGGFFPAAYHVPLTLNVDLCGNNVINHFICEVTEILSLACVNVIFLEFITYVVGVIILVIPITFIVVSYIKIMMAILKIASSAGRRKAFSTCGSHMIVVAMFYSSAMAVYMKPVSSSVAGTNKVIAIFYVFVTPMLNPVIYTLRNNDVKVAVPKLRGKIFVLPIRKRNCLRIYK